MNKGVFLLRSAIVAGVLLAVVSAEALARDAAFLTPGASGTRAGAEAVRVDPKPDIDIGETPLGVAKRATVFFVNQMNTPVRIERITIAGDSSVSADEAANDCSKQGTIAALSRCSVEVSLTPSAVGPWAVEVIMTHNGAGRITRARLSGKTSGYGAGDGRTTGLSVMGKEVKPIDFGSIDVGGGKVVRSSLMINDSPEPITIYSIEVIEPENGLQRLTNGCAVGMELASGASCPVTLLWEPREASPVSTDLILRHSGKSGFTVVPVRGVARGGSVGDAGRSFGRQTGGLPAPPTAMDLEKEIAGRIAPVADDAFKGGGSISGGGKQRTGTLSLIGTTGTRAIFLLPSGDTTIVSVGASFETGSGAARLVAVRSNSVDAVVGGKKVTYPLEAASSLVSSALLDQTKKGDKGSNISGSGVKK